MKYCPWCGRVLELKAIDLGKTIRYVCSKCSWKLKEVAKPEIKTPELAPEDKPKEAVDIRTREIPDTNPKLTWPVIIGAAIFIILVIIFIKAFLV